MFARVGAAAAFGCPAAAPGCGGWGVSGAATAADRGGGGTTAPGPPRTPPRPRRRVAAVGRSAAPLRPRTGLRPSQRRRATREPHPRERASSGTPLLLPLSRRPPTDATVCSEEYLPASDAARVSPPSQRPSP